MNQFVIALMAIMALLSGCASSGGAVSAGAEDNGGLAEIAPYDEATYDALPDVVAAE